MIKYLFILFSISLYSQNIWYVDRDATGANTGRSWTDAWTTTDSVWGNGLGINWRIVQAGDTIYISGGTDSTRYLKPSGQTATYIRGNDSDTISFSPQVVVAPAYHTSHNGEVWFYQDTYTLNHQYLFHLKNISGIKMVNFNFWTDIPDVDVLAGVTMIESASNITLEKCNFTNARTGGALTLQTTSNIIIDSCSIQNLTNSNTVDQDIFTMSGGAGGHTIIDTRIINRCIVDSTDAHPDFVQIGGAFGDETYPETKFINNFFLQMTPDRISEYNSGIYISSGMNQHNQRFTFINNLFVLEIADTTYTGSLTGAPSIWLRGEDPQGVAPLAHYSLRLFNNTFIAPGRQIVLTRCDTIIAKNNILLQTNDLGNTTVSSPLIGWVGYESYQSAYVDIDYNYWFINNWTSGKVFQLGDNFHTYNWGEWQGLGYDVNSDTGTINLYTVRDSVISAYYTTTGRNEGVDLSALYSTYPSLQYDILGNPIVGTRDLGALEYQGETPAPDPPAATDSKIMRGSNGKIWIDSRGKIIKGR